GGGAVGRGGGAQRIRVSDLRPRRLLRARSHHAERDECPGDDQESENEPTQPRRKLIVVTILAAPSGRLVQLVAQPGRDIGAGRLVWLVGRVHWGLASMDSVRRRAVGPGQK